MQFQGRLQLVKAGLRWCLDVHLYMRLYSEYHKKCCIFEEKIIPGVDKEPIELLTYQSTISPEG